VNDGNSRLMVNDDGYRLSVNGIGCGSLANDDIYILNKKTKTRECFPVA